MLHVTSGIHSEIEGEIDSFSEKELALFETPSGEALSEYLELMEDTEAPRQFVMWSLISGAAALIGKNAAFVRGPLYTVSANLYVILIGPSGVRKSSAISQIMGFLKETSVNIGPTDSSGQRQGIMSALVGLHRFTEGKPWRARDENTIPALFPWLIHPRKPSDIFFGASELGRLFGNGNKDLADFFNDLWDGADIDYQTRASETVIRKPVANLLGATTPANLASILPDGAAGHGILSRILFVFAKEKYKDVPIPPIPREEWYDKRDLFLERLQWIDENRVNFVFSPTASEFYESVYTFNPRLKDARLEAYNERRPTHLLKVAMALAALRNDTVIQENDLNLAHILLKQAEPLMHHAVEYFGKNKIFAGRQLMIQYLRAHGGIASRADLIGAAMSELNQREADEAIDGMIKSKEVGSPDGGARIILTELADSIRGLSSRKR